RFVCNRARRELIGTPHPNRRQPHMAQVNAVPAGLHTLTPQLTVEGAAEAIEFYKKAFGAEEKSRAPDPSGKKVWHSELRIGDSAFFVNDAFPDMGGSAHPTELWLYTD